MSETEFLKHLEGGGKRKRKMTKKMKISKKQKLETSRSLGRSKNKKGGGVVRGVSGGGKRGASFPQRGVSRRHWVDKRLTKKNLYKWRDVKRVFDKSDTKAVIGKRVLPKDLFVAVNKFNGFNEVMKKRCWNDVRLLLKVPQSTSIGNVLKNCYMNYFEELF